MNNVVCIKYGRYYAPFYVNRLFAGVKRHLSRPFRFVCVTNDPEGIRPEVECVPFAEDPGVPGRKWPNIFSKLTLFKDGFADLEGPTLYLDLDVLITGPLDRFFDYHPGEFCIIRNWIEFYKRIFRKENPANRHLFAKGSQKLQTRAMFHAGKVNWWPADWVSSFKRQCIPAFPLNLFLAPHPPPKAASIVAFHGHPDIPEAQAGYRFRSRNGTRECVRPHLTSLPAPWIDSLWHE